MQSPAEQTWQVPQVTPVHGLTVVDGPTGPSVLQVLHIVVGDSGSLPSRPTGTGVPSSTGLSQPKRETNITSAMAKAGFKRRSSPELRE